MINTQLAPVSFTDALQQPRGIAIDVLEQITRRTGLHFEIVFADSFDAMLDAVTQGKVDMLGAIGVDPQQAARVRYSRPFMISPRVLVTRSDAPPWTTAPRCTACAWQCCKAHRCARTLRSLQRLKRRTRYSCCRR